MCGSSGPPPEPSFPLPNGAQSPVWQNFPTQRNTALAAETAGQAAPGGDTATTMGASLGTGKKTGPK